MKIMMLIIENKYCKLLKCQNPSSKRKVLMSATDCHILPNVYVISLDQVVLDQIKLSLIIIDDVVIIINIV